ncbi:ATP-binding protein [Actinokineospora cianjurensis]|nr:tetratricopeptide repeat protein [Actinokineospora cianjurensis]
MAEGEFQGRGEVRVNDISGSHTGPVIQIGSVTGALHLHPTPAVDRPTPRQLPAPPGCFVNRRAELAELTAVVDGGAPAVPLSVVTGSGGIGKTSLALRWAHQHLDRFPDGQLYVDMRGFASFEQPVPATRALRGFLGALGVGEDNQPADVEAQAATYRSLVAGKRVLVVVDNAKDCADVLRLLPGSASCAVLVTSRLPLGELISKGARIVDLDVLTGAQARQLLTEHVGAERLAAEPDAAAELLGYCAGLPLAVGIVAARVVTQPGQSLAGLAEELREESERLDGLDVGDTGMSLRAVLSWSYQSLAPQVAALFRLLGAAPGNDIGLDSVVVLTGHSRAKTRSLLRALEAAHLVRQHAPGRYRMHDLVRLYAGGLTSTDDPETTTAVHRLVHFLVHTAHDGARKLAPYRPPVEIPVGGADPGLVVLATARDAITWFAVEHQGLLDTQQYALRRGLPEAAWQIAWSLVGFHHRQGRPDGQASWRAALAAAELIGRHRDVDAVLAVTHRHLGYVELARGDHATAVVHLAQAAELAERVGSLPSQVATLRAMAGAHDQAGDRAAAISSLRRARELCQTAGLRVWEAEVLGQLGLYHADAGEYDAAARYLEYGLALHREIGNTEGVAYALSDLGSVAARQGRHEDAVEHYRRCLELLPEFGNVFHEAVVLDKLAESLHTLGSITEAAACWRRALDLATGQNRPELAERISRRLQACP